jgi:hypothetical protein
MARIALLFSGLPRQWSPCAPSQLGLFREHEADAFFHFWDTVDDREKREILDAYRPRAHRFEPPADFTAFDELVPRLDNINFPSRMLSMYYSWKQVATLFEAYRRAHGVHYDFAVRLRSDLMFFDGLDGLIPQLGPLDLAVSTHHDFGLINDMFAIGGVAPILYYHSLHDHVRAYKDEVIFNPELLLIHHLNRNPLGIRCLATDLVMLVFRPHMAGRPLEECLEEHPGASKWRDPEIVASFRAYHGRWRGEEGIRHVERFRDRQLRKLEEVGPASPVPGSPRVPGGDPR